MKLTEVTLSYPFVYYKIDVTHFTARRSTAIEWLILEVIKRTQLNNWYQGYQGMRIEDFFSSMFGITDSNKMILPCLLNLRDIGTLQLDNIYDQTDMAQTFLSQLHLTHIGVEMQRNGKLPGRESTDRIIFYYNATANKLLRDSKKIFYKEKQNGIPVLEIKNVEEITFPEPLIRNMIEILKKEKDHPSWLEKETVIQQVVPVESKLLWKNIIKSFNVGEGMRCSIEGNESKDVDEAVLLGLDLPEPDTSIPIIQVKNPDSEFNVIVPADKIQILFEQMNNRNNMFIVDKNYFSDNIQAFTGGKTNVNNLQVLCNAEETNIKIKPGLITISIKESLLPDGLVYLDTTQAVGLGRFTLSASNVNRLVELAYIPKKIEANPKTITLEYIYRLYNQYPRMLHILQLFGMQNEELKLIEKQVKNLSSIEDKLKYIKQLNEESSTLFKKKCVSDEKINRLILDTERIASEVTDLSSVQRILEGYASIGAIKNSQSTIETLLDILLSNLKKSYNLSGVISFWKQIQNLGNQYIKFINQKGLYKKLYSDSVIKEIVSKFSDEDLKKLEPYTPIETLILNMRNNTDNAQEIFELSFFEEISEESMMRSVMSHRSELEKLINYLEIWRKHLESFSRISDFEEIAIVSPNLTMTAKNFQKLSSVLSKFSYDKSLRFSKICVLDTNALMHMPELFKMLDGKDTMVIIPQTMLAELDDLKDNEDEEIAYQARVAIRMINNYSTYDWINLNEKSNIELLSNDLDPNNQDCRIISIALKYIIHNPILITDDLNMKNIAKSQGITTMTTSGFNANMQQAEREQKYEKNKHKNKKKDKR